MVASFELSVDLHKVDLEMWARLRNEGEFDKWCCEQEGQVWSPVSLTASPDEAGATMNFRVHNFYGKVNPLPYALRLVIGDENPKFRTRTKWWTHHGADEAHSEA